MGVSLEFWGSVALQLFVATLCGGLIGYQRETSERPAGFRTHILVCVGSAVYMLVSVAVAGDRFDQGRIAAQVASGIGFLGAGTIIKQGSIVRGLTTAASLWAVAGIGLAAGYGGPALVIALLGTLTVFLALSALRSVEARIEPGHQQFSLSLQLSQPRQRLEWVRQTLAAHAITVFDVSVTGEQDAFGDVDMAGRTPSRDDLELAVNELLKGEAVRNVRWQMR